MIFLFTSSIFPGLRIPLLPSERHLPLFPSTIWENFSTLLLPPGLSLSPPASRSVLNASFYPIYFFFWNPIPFSISPCQVSFRPGRSTLDQILFLFHISDGFNKPRPGSRTILSTIDFLKAFDSVWHPALFHKLISAGLPPCFARWNQSFLSDKCACVVYQNQKSHSFRVRRGVLQGSVLGPVFFSLFINDLPVFLPSSSAAPFMLTIWPCGLPPPPRPPLRWRPHKDLCFDWSAGLSTGVFLSIRANVRLSSSQWIPTKLASSPTSCYSAPASVSIQLQLFLG